MAAVIGITVLVTLAGCSGLTGGSDEGTVTSSADVVEADQREANATGVTQTLRIEVDDSTAGGEWESFSAAYPRDRFTVNSAAHDAIDVGVDTDGDGTVEEGFDESHVSGVNNNDYSFTVTLETGYTLSDGDVLVVEYPAVDNPKESGEYEVTATVNGEQTANGTVAIEEK